MVMPPDFQDEPPRKESAAYLVHVIGGILQNGRMLKSAWWVM